MTELFLHYVWQYQLYNRELFYTTHNEPIRVKQIGTYNTDAGPDFTNAHIYIDNTLWVGDIEIHVNAHDWYSHKHSKNSAYNSVILHVVFVADSDITNTYGNTIPTAVLSIPEHIIETYTHIQKMPTQHHCIYNLETINNIYKSQWFDTLVVERFEEKTATIIARLITNNNDWEHTLYESLAANFGFKTNSLAFEKLAQSINFKYFAKHKNSLLQIESLLFGNANLFPSNHIDSYTQERKQEYSFIQKKYNISPIPKELWKFARLRPANFPTIRIAQFAQLMLQSQNLCSRILECKTIQDYTSLFTIQLNEYWNTHYMLSQKAPYKVKNMGIDSIYNILINTVTPFLFAYGKYRNHDELCTKALDLLEQLPSEKNSIISEWNRQGTPSFSAFRSQALLQLSNKYCKNKRCLQCAFAHRIFTLKQ